MKKFSLSLVTISSLLSASFCFAAAASDLSNFYSTLHPQPVVNTLKATLHPPTDITIINASSNYIWAVVPGSSVNDRITPGFNDHLYGYGLNDIYVVLQDPYRNSYFSDYVCRLAIVTTYGGPGSYRIHIDSDLCNS